MHGVSADYIREMAEVGFANLPMRDLVEARMHGVNAAYVRQMRAEGFDEISLAQLTELRIHDISPEYLREIEALHEQMRQDAPAVEV